MKQFQSPIPAVDLQVHKPPLDTFGYLWFLGHQGIQDGKGCQGRLTGLPGAWVKFQSRAFPPIWEPYNAGPPSNQLDG